MLNGSSMSWRQSNHKRSGGAKKQPVQARAGVGGAKSLVESKTDPIKGKKVRNLVMKNQNTENDQKGSLSPN